MKQSQSNNSSAEQIFFQDASVSVTNTRFVVGSQTFAMRNITSVEAQLYPPSRSGPVTALLVGALIALIGFASNSFIVGALGVVLSGSSIIWLFRQRPTFGVSLATAGGEVRAIEHPNQEFIEKVVAALNTSIMSHRF